MAENRQYLCHDMENGTLLINEDVLETIVMNAVKEVEGVAGFSSIPALDIIEVIGKKNIGKALKISIDQDNKLNVICNITILYGHNILDTASNAQKAIFSALASAVNANVNEVNVNVCGIIRK